MMSRGLSRSCPSLFVLMIAVLLVASPLSAASPYGGETISGPRASTAPGTNASVPSTKGSTWGFGTEYRLEGLLIVHPEATTLTTTDGRVFGLIISGREAAKYHDKHVIVDGMAHQADDLYRLKVKKIALAPSAPPSASAAPFKQQQTPPSLISQAGSRFGEISPPFPQKTPRAPQIGLTSVWGALTSPRSISAFSKIAHFSQNPPPATSERHQPRQGTTSTTFSRFPPEKPDF